MSLISNNAVSKVKALTASPLKSIGISRFSRMLLLGGAIVALPIAIYALNTSFAPGGNFNLSGFDLDTYTGSAKNATVIHSDELEGKDGFQNGSYFFTDSSDGSMTMKVPGDPADSGCSTTPGSEHCRTELAETHRWEPSASTNRLNVTLSVPKPDNGDRGTAIGQILQDSGPVCQVLYNQSGDLVIRTDDGVTSLANIKVGDKFSYELEFSSSVMKIAVNGGDFRTISVSNAGDSSSSYFKAGNYNQGSVPSEVHVYALTIQH